MSEHTFQEELVFRLVGMALFVFRLRFFGTCSVELVLHSGTGSVEPQALQKSWSTYCPDVSFCQADATSKQCSTVRVQQQSLRRVGQVVMTGASSVWFRLHHPTQHPPLRFFALGDVRLPQANRGDLNESVSWPRLMIL